MFFEQILTVFQVSAAKILMIPLQIALIYNFGGSYYLIQTVCQNTVPQSDSSGADFDIQYRLFPVFFIVTQGNTNENN